MTPAQKFRRADRRFMRAIARSSCSPYSKPAKAWEQAWGAAARLYRPAHEATMPRDLGRVSDPDPWPMPSHTTKDGFTMPRVIGARAESNMSIETATAMEQSW